MKKRVDGAKDSQLMPEDLLLMKSFESKFNTNFFDFKTNLMNRSTIMEGKELSYMGGD